MASRSTDSERNKEITMIMYFGFQPGMDGNHGVAALEEDPTGRRRCVAMARLKTADAALRWFLDRIACAMNLGGIGIGTLTEWCLGSSGDRPGEVLMREAPASDPSIDPNAIVGAVALGGMGVLIKLREHRHDLVVSEAHPRALYTALTGGPSEFDVGGIDMCRWLSRRVDVDALMANACITWNSAQWGALMSAWACAEGLKAGWHDLHDAQHLPRFGTPVRPAGKTKFLWPVSITPTSRRSR